LERAYGIRYGKGDVISVALDMADDARTLRFSTNGEDQGVAVEQLPDGPWCLVVQLWSKGNAVELLD